MSSKKKMYITAQNLVSISPIGPAQEKAFISLEANKNLFLTGSAGTGKTFILLFYFLIFQKPNFHLNLLFLLQKSTFLKI